MVGAQSGNVTGQEQQLCEQMIRLAPRTSVSREAHRVAEMAKRCNKKVLT
jgi:hypothetical protein